MKKAFRITQAVTDTRENTDRTAALLGSCKEYIDEAAIFESFSHHGFWGVKTTTER